jgi:hypothetical protein
MLLRGAQPREKSQQTRTEKGFGLQLALLPSPKCAYKTIKCPMADIHSNSSSA